MRGIEKWNLAGARTIRASVLGIGIAREVAVIEIAQNNQKSPP